MLFKSVAILAALAAPALAFEPVTCTKNATQNIEVQITSASNFCTMLTGYGVNPVAPNEGCSSSYCLGGSTIGQKMPDGYILSATYAKNDTANYVQVTGCINSTVWAQNPTDEGGQMDSHGWPYHCTGYNKFVSLIEPATNTFCIRCCTSTDNSDCDTSHSTNGCWNVVPGLYQMPDGSACAAPPGAPVASSSVSGVPSATVSGTASASASGTTSAGAAPTSGSTTGSGSSGSPSVKAGASAGIRVGTALEVAGAMMAVAVAMAL